MSDLLVSVQNKQEAQAAIAGGCQLLDIKDPRRGSLGRADVSTIEQILQSTNRIAPQLPTSVALGELCEWDQIPDIDMALNRATYLKVGSAGISDPAEWGQRVRELRAKFHAAGVCHPRWIAAFYADSRAADSWDCLADPETLIQLIEQQQLAGLLIDTFDKHGRSFAELVAGSGKLVLIRKLLDQCRRANLLTAIAGRLSSDEVRGLCHEQLRPTYFAVRSAVCIQGERLSGIESARVRDLRELLDQAASQRVALP